ncbi:fatty acid--CoA ligase family protein [bacterium]|nr:fatty acid--CoA ligase family protein [bacterium]
MKDLFYIDPAHESTKTWQNLIEDVRAIKIYQPIYSSSDSYRIFVNIILSLLIGRPITLIDHDISEYERGIILDDSESRIEKQVIKQPVLDADISKETLTSLIQDVEDSWCITLFTSGTTGKPKSVVHSFKSITRSIKQSPAHQDDVWGYTYIPTHMAGVQVFFQAVLNGNPLVDLSGGNALDLGDIIRKYGVTSISATPTFYRVNMPYFGICDNVRQLTIGGEGYEKTLLDTLRKGFPNARLRNVYASTEAGALLASTGEEFVVKESFKLLVKVVENELWIHRDALGDGVVQDEEWYRTGDSVEILSEDPTRFRFVGRKEEMINVGGNKVNPKDVEDALRQYPGIVDVHVYGKRNSVLGNIVCCDIVSEESAICESAIRTYLAERLQEYKIPRIIKFVDRVETTRSGKTKRG